MIMKRKPVILILSLIMMIVISTPCSIFAAEGPLYVYDGDTLMREYSYEDLEAVWEAEGSKAYNYSGYNTYATYKTIREDDETRATGPTVLGLIENAGVDLDTLAENDTFKIQAADGVYCRLTYQQLAGDTYYFPNGNIGTEHGMKGDESSREGAVVMPVIIDLKDTKQHSTMRIGQVAPNEQNWPAHMHYMTDTKGGKIIIQRGAAVKESADLTTSVGSKTQVVPGQKITINGGAHYVKIYYTTDGTEPTVDSDIYNFNSYTGPEADNPIIVPNEIGSTFTIKCFKHRYGYFDSNVQTFKYTIVKQIPKVTKGTVYAVSNQKYKVTKVATSSARGAVTFTKSKNAKTVYVPKAVKLRDGRYYNVNIVAAKAFTPTRVRIAYIGANVTTLKPYALKGSRATKVFIKTKKLKKVNVKKSLTGSKVKYVVIRVGTKKANRTYTTKYKKFFTKANAGRKVTVKY